MENKEIKYNLFTGIRKDGDVDHKLAAGAAYCDVETRMYRLKLMMFPGLTYYMHKNENCSDRYTIFAKRMNRDGQCKLYAPVGSAALDASLQSFLEIKFPLLRSSIFMNLYPVQEKTE